jgi:hypothetical protein
MSVASSDADEGATRQLGVPFLRLSVSEASEAEVAEWLLSVEPAPADAVAPNKATKAPASNGAASAAS